jgi:hypothetical protein
LPPKQSAGMHSVATTTTQVSLQVRVPDLNTVVVDCMRIGTIVAVDVREGGQPGAIEAFQRPVSPLPDRPVAIGYIVIRDHAPE